MITTTVLQLFVFVNVYCHALEKCGFFSSTLLLMSCLFACSGIETMCKINPVCHTSKLFHPLWVISTERKCEISCRKCSENASKLISATRVQAQVVLKRAARRPRAQPNSRNSAESRGEMFHRANRAVSQTGSRAHFTAGQRHIAADPPNACSGAHAKNTMTTGE